jgi:uncharacterized protein YbaR (Trm112 family)
LITDWSHRFARQRGGDPTGFGLVTLLCYTRMIMTESEERPLSLDSVLDILRCPACASKPAPDPGKLDLVSGKWLVCQDCNRKYPIRDRIPVMLIKEGEKYQRIPVEELGDP